MNELDLTIFYSVHGSSTIVEIKNKLEKIYNKIITKKTIYTSIYRLEKQGLITKKESGNRIIIQQTPMPISSYLHNLIESYPHLIKKEFAKGKSLEILLTLLRNKCTVKLISGTIKGSDRNTIRYLTKFHKLALITKLDREHSTNAYAWEINKVNIELVKFLEAYEEFRAFRLLNSIDKNAALIWLNGIEFLCKSQKIIRHDNFKKTGAEVLEKYGLKLLPSEKFYFYTNRKLNMWDHAFLTVLSRKQDPTQIRYLAYLYKKQKPNLSEFVSKGTYYDEHAMKCVIDLFSHKKETSELKFEDIKELEKMYGM